MVHWDYSEDTAKEGAVSFVSGNKLYIDIIETSSNLLRSRMLSFLEKVVSLILQTLPSTVQICVQELFLK